MMQSLVNRLHPNRSRVPSSATTEGGQVMQPSPPGFASLEARRAIPFSAVHGKRVKVSTNIGSTDLDWSVAARCVAERCRIYDYRSHSELAMILKDFSELHQMPPEWVINKSILQWENYKANADRLKWVYGSPIQFFRWFAWNSEEQWPWVRAVPKPAASLGVNRAQHEPIPEEMKAEIAAWKQKRPSP